MIFLAWILCVPCYGSSRLDDPEYLVGYWKLNSNALDYSGYGNDGTWAGDELHGTTPWGKSSVDFGGDDDFISFGNVLNLTSQYSISFWFKPDAVSGGSDKTIIAKMDADDDVTFWIRIQQSELALNFTVAGSSTQTIASVADLVADSWYHAVITYTDGHSYIYLNGAYDTYETDSTSIPVTAGNLVFGAKTNGTGDFYDGEVAEVRVYNIILTADEVAKLYTRTYPKYSIVAQPIDTIPDVADSTLEGAWLNRAVLEGKDLSSNDVNFTAETSVIPMSVGMDFDGTESRLNSDAAGPELNTSDITVSAWINPESDGEVGRVMSYRDGGYFGITNEAAGLVQGELYFAYATTPALFFTEKVIPINTWTHLAGTLDGASGVIQMYINGTAVSSEVNSTTGDGARTVTGGAGNWAIGNYISSIRTWDGQLKDIRIYSEAKTADWIAAEYAKGVPDDSLVLSVPNGDKDLSRYGHTLTNNGGDVGIMGFDGVSGDIEVTRTSALDMTGNTARTWVVVFNADSDGEGNYGRLLEKTDGYMFSTSAESSGAVKLSYKIDHGTTDINSETSRIIRLNKVEFLTAVYNEDGAKKLKIYMNGVLSTTSDAGAGDLSDDSSGNVYIGNKSDDSRTFDGTIKDVRIYNEAKSAEWIKEDYNRTKVFY